AAKVRQPNPADQGFVECKDQKVVRLVSAPILGVARDPRAETGAAQRVGRPTRLPRGKKVPRARPQARPSFVVAALGRPQIDAMPGQAERICTGEKKSRKGFSLRRHRK